MSRVDELKAAIEAAEQEATKAYRTWVRTEAAPYEAIAENKYIAACDRANELREELTRLEAEGGPK